MAGCAYVTRLIMGAALGVIMSPGNETTRHTTRAAVNIVHDEGQDGALGELRRFRELYYGCLTKRADALFELTDAVLCADGPVTSLVGLSLAAEHRRGHGALYDAVNSGVVEISRLRRDIAGLTLPRDNEGRIMLAVDVSHWLRPDAATAPGRAFCHVHGRGKNASQIIPGWPYSFVVALEPGRSSWTAVLDAVRLQPDDDATDVTAAQVREVINLLIQAGQWKPGDPPVLVVFDSGYDVTRLAWLLRDLPVQLLARLRSNRVFYLPAPDRVPGQPGRTRRHGPELDLDQPGTQPAPGVTTSTDTTRYGTAQAAAWDQCHPKLARRGGWEHHTGELPVVEGTIIRLTVDRLPGDRSPQPLWLWSSQTGLTPDDVNRLWRAYLRRFDIEHTFRLFKQTLGWTKPRVRNPEAADLWTWLLIAAHTQLRLARDLAPDLRHPWERQAPGPGRLTPARVRRGFRNLRPKTPNPAGAPKPSRPGPGRPPGSKNKHVAPQPPVGKTRLQTTTQ
jgi:hypothetical protein